jgi:hypothetical protein
MITHFILTLGLLQAFHKLNVVLFGDITQAHIMTLQAGLQGNFARLCMSMWQCKWIA